MNEFIEKYAEVFPLFEKHGFKDPVVHRRMVGINSDKILILVTDMNTEKPQPKAFPYRLVNLEDDLKPYFEPKCKFLLFTPQDLQQYTLQELDTDKYPAVRLTRNLSSIDIANELIRIFGEKWVGGNLAEITCKNVKNPGWSPTVFSSATSFVPQKLDLASLLVRLDAVVEEYVKQNPTLKKEEIQQQIASHFALSSPTKTTGPE